MIYYRRRKAGASCGTSAGYLPAAVTDMEQYQAKTPGVLWSEGHWEVGDFSVSPIPNLLYFIGTCGIGTRRLGLRPGLVKNAGELFLMSMVMLMMVTPRCEASYLTFYPFSVFIWVTGTITKPEASHQIHLESRTNNGRKLLFRFSIIWSPYTWREL